MDSSDITRHASQADIIFTSWFMIIMSIYESYQSLKCQPIFLYATICSQQQNQLAMSNADVKMWSHKMLSTCLSVFNPLLKTRICSSLLSYLDSICSSWTQRVERYSAVYFRLFPAPHNWSEASHSTTFSWQPLGPLLKVKLLEGYI